MALLTTQFCNRITPLTATFAAATAGGDSFSSGSDVYLHVKNGSGSVVTVTVATPGSVDGLAVADFTFTVPATTGDVEIGPFPEDLFGATAIVTYSAVTTVTIACKKYNG